MKRTTLAKLTPQSCLEATADYLIRSSDLAAASSEVLEIDNRIWLQFTDLSPRDELDDNEEVRVPYYRGLLWPRLPFDPSQTLTREVIVFTLYRSNPTPEVIIHPTQTEIRSSVAGIRLAVFATATGAECREVVGPRERFGETMLWPFPD